MHKLSVRGKRDEDMVAIFPIGDMQCIIEIEIRFKTGCDDYAKETPCAMAIMPIASNRNDAALTPSFVDQNTRQRWIDYQT